jgi:hypothetical protein
MQGRSERGRKVEIVKTVVYDVLDWCSQSVLSNTETGTDQSDWLTCIESVPRHRNFPSIIILGQYPLTMAYL